MRNRTLEDQEVKYLVLDMLKRESARDKQRMVGASNIGNPCDYCLAHAVAGTGGGKSNPFWLGARIGTAIHAALEEQAELHIDTPLEHKFNALRGAKIEQKIVLGTIPGYGTIKSKPDLVLVEHNHLLDYKGSTKAKMQKMRATNTVPIQYEYQQQLYAWGLNREGIQVDRISLVFIARDGSGDGDVWVHSFDYDEDKAVKAWERLEGIVAYIHEFGVEGIDNLDSHPDCWYCSNIIGRT